MEHMVWARHLLFPCIPEARSTKGNQLNQTLKSLDVLRNKGCLRSTIDWPASPHQDWTLRGCSRLLFALVVLLTCDSTPQQLGVWPEDANHCINSWWISWVIERTTVGVLPWGKPTYFYFFWIESRFDILWLDTACLLLASLWTGCKQLFFFAGPNSGIGWRALLL